MKKKMPDGAPSDPYSLIALVDILEHTNQIKRMTRKISKIVYQKVA